MYEGIEKLAVTLDQLRQATNKLFNRKDLIIIKKRVVNMNGHLTKNKNMKFLEDLGTKAYEDFRFKSRIPKGIDPERLTNNLSDTYSTVRRGAVRETEGTVPSFAEYINQRNPYIKAFRKTNADLSAKKNVIFIGEDANKLLRKVFNRTHDYLPEVKNKASKEVISRSGILHEGAEAGRQPSKYSLGMAGHVSIKPFIQDINIGNTYTGSGAKEVKNYMQHLRKSELEQLARETGIPYDVLKNKRFNRHDIRRFQEMHDRAIIPRMAELQDLRRKLTDSRSGTRFRNRRKKKILKGLHQGLEDLKARRTVK